MEGFRVNLLSTEFYMGVKAVKIEPGELPVIYIEGRNESGKTSTLDSIWAAIAAQVGEGPINRDAAAATILLELGNEKGDKLEITRRITAKTSRIEVSLNGEGQKSPQTLLDSLFSTVTMDPEAFARMKDSDRIETLLELTGRRDEITALDAEHGQVYDTRTGQNRIVKSLADRYDVAYEAIDCLGPLAPKEVKSSAEILEKMRIEQSRVAGLQNKEHEITNLNAAMKEDMSSIENNERRIKEYEEALEKMRDEIGDFNSAITASRVKIEVIRGEINNAPPDTSAEIEAELTNIETHNEQARKYQECGSLRREHVVEKSKATALTNRLGQIGDEKTKILKESLPFKELEIEDGGVFINHTPFNSLCGWEKIMVGLEIAVRMNPGLRVIKIASGGELDSASWAKVEDFAIRNKLQVWTAVVCDKHNKGFFIEEGVLSKSENENG